MNTIQTVANEALVNVAVGIITLLAAYAMYYIRVGVSMAKVKTSKIKGEEERTLFENALADVEKLATKSVGAIEQTTAQALRDAVKAGIADRSQLVALGKESFNDVKSQIKPQAQEIITKNLGSFDDYLKKCIENAVLEVKQKSPYITVTDISPELPDKE